MQFWWVVFLFGVYFCSYFAIGIRHNTVVNRKSAEECGQNPAKFSKMQYKVTKHSGSKNKKGCSLC